MYDLVLQFLRTLFLRTRFVHYCSLRAELLMALHDKEVHDITAVDPCHKFTWCLDACIREGRVDAKRYQEWGVGMSVMEWGVSMSLTVCASCII